MSLERPLTLTLIPGPVAVCRLAPDAPVPAWATGAVTSVTRTQDELSVVCSEDAVPASVRAERGFCCLAVVGPLDLALTGILAGLSAPLAAEGISIFVLSTFDTDLLLVRAALLSRTVATLRGAGHHVVGVP